MEVRVLVRHPLRRANRCVSRLVQLVHAVGQVLSLLHATEDQCVVLLEMCPVWIFPLLGPAS